MKDRVTELYEIIKANADYAYKPNTPQWEMYWKAYYEWHELTQKRG